MALLCESQVFSSYNVHNEKRIRTRVRLCTKVGGDDIGIQLYHELKDAGVEVETPLFVIGNKGSTSSISTIVVSESEQTRTCFYTSGSCGELTIDDLNDNTIEDMFTGNVVLLHSDSRHTEVALLLARESKKRGILISVDVEKDRNCKAFDELLQLADIIFTNSSQMEDILGRLNKENAIKHSQDTVDEPTISHTKVNNCISESMMENSLISKLISKSIQPSSFFTRWYQQIGKQIVITKGSKGAIHVETISIKIDTATSDDGVERNETKKNQVAPHDVQFTIQNSRCFQVMETFLCESSLFVKSNDQDEKGQLNSQTQRFLASYRIQTTGIVKEMDKVIDTTGAGDAFIGSYLMAFINSDRLMVLTINECLQFASWVAGKKVQGGHGARSSLPTGHDIDRILGTDVNQVKSSLSKMIGEFTLS